MPTLFVSCEGCGHRQAAFLEDAVAEQLRNGKPFKKHCGVCHATTDWVIGADGASPEGTSPKGARGYHPSTAHTSKRQ